ncbi:HNH endonuclease [Leptolyngbya sp. FACHB-261]|uniref:HNH endonuclease n=1 Tax=Leptolyngbya sp. FACHB-261 TaxID=2692806 RepID=UPI0016889BAB|nr:HNH endonuclease [Leptolyngbya sp. FACHB-261]MBD2099498.1 HNH endonuclease [Leptolyngbya sp. FACHB-261]
MSKDLHYYEDKFSRLNVNRHRKRGVAPYKPALLLAVIELIEQGLLTQNRVFISADLIATFIKYRDLLGPESYQADLAQPFFYMRSDGFWHLKAQPGLEAVVSKGVLTTLKKLRDTVQYAYFDDELFSLLNDSTSRHRLIRILVVTWFPDRNQEIAQLLKINSFQDFQDRLREKGGAVYAVEELKDENKTFVRDAAFRKIVLRAYQYQCAFCGLKVDTSLNQNIVDGAHIKPFSEFRDDRINNGLSLCKNHHWAFDRGWFSIEDDYTILVSNDLREESPHAKPMQEFQGERILLPNQENYFPRSEALRWHRENRFNRGEQLLTY